MTSCRSNRTLKYHNFPDAVTSLNQVDPAYRKYFAGQQGRNYSVEDQRKALAAAIRTSRTPVPAYVPRSAMASSRKASSRKRSARSKRYVASRKRSTYRRGKSVSRKRAVAKRKTVTRKRSVAKRKTSTRRRRRG